MSDSAPLVVIAGPTASGKSSLAIELALRFGGEIISCDSVAVYREFEIGTAKPSPEERAEVPHHLIDVFAPDAYCTAGEYARLAREAARQITSRGALPIVCGGTGLYLRAMLDGLFDGPERNEQLRDRLLRRRRAGSLWRLLRHLDPEAAGRIHARDEAKLVRAIEVCVSASRPMSELLREGRDPLQGYRVLRIGLAPERPSLYERINHRCAEMFDHGLIEETRTLIARYGADVFAMRSLGYRQAAESLRGECSAAEAVARAQQGHRNFAKRQLTWFRADPEMQWLPCFGTSAAPQATEMVEHFIAASERSDAC
jgi:tRNA dimethylallyltransferase